MMYVLISPLAPNEQLYVHVVIYHIFLHIKDNTLMLSFFIKSYN